MIPAIYTGFQPAYRALLDERVNQQSNRIDTLWLQSPVGVDDIRSVSDFLQQVPAFSEYRTVVVDLNRITDEAQQALLGILETEYPAGSLLLYCDDTRNVLSTVMSRCLLLESHAPDSFGNSLQMLLQDGNSALRSAEITQATDLGLPVELAPTASDYAVADKAMLILKNRDISGMVDFASNGECDKNVLTALRERLRERKLYRELMRTYQHPVSSRVVLMRLMTDVLTKRKKS